MKVEVSNSELVDDLVGFLRRARCSAERSGPETLTVSLADAPSEDLARRELEAYLATWQTIHPDVHVRRLAEYDL